jgi:hypothetical protein
LQTALFHEALSIILYSRVACRSMTAPPAVTVAVLVAVAGEREQRALLGVPEADQRRRLLQREDLR